jgi:hypothetical protein
VKQLQAFLGLFNFYRHFIPAAAKLVLPLTRSLRGGPKGTTPLAWSPAMTAAFQAARVALSSSAVLAHPVAGAELSLVTDASAIHVGAVVQQRRRGQAWRPLGFFSAQLNKAEINYSAFDRELLAVVAAIRHFRYILEGRTFVVFTDHKPLVGALHRRSDPTHLRPSAAPPLLYSRVRTVHSTHNRRFQHCRRHPLQAFGRVLGSSLLRLGGDHHRRRLLRPWRGGSGVNRGKSAHRVLSSPRHRWVATLAFGGGFGGTGGGSAGLPRLPARQVVAISSGI